MKLHHTIRIAFAANALITDDNQHPTRALILPLLILSLRIPDAITISLTQHAAILFTGLLIIAELLFIGQPRFRVML